MFNILTFYRIFITIKIYNILFRSIRILIKLNCCGKGNVSAHQSRCPAISTVRNYLISLLCGMFNMYKAINSALML